MSASQDQTNAARAHVAQERERYLNDLEDYLRIPSISTDPAYAESVRKCADFLCEAMRKAGLEARLIEATEAGCESGHPMVYAERIEDPSLPTVLFYGHYDVQPPDPLELWESPPFEPRRAKGNVYARGATDDKGQSLTHLKAVESILGTRDQLPVNVKFLVEGEEEGGGETIDAFVAKDQGKLLSSDCVVVSDTSLISSEQPSLLYGLKGLVYTEVRLVGPSHDLHSGLFGGAVTNPANALAHVIAQLRCETTGRVLIPGFYDDVQDLEDWERESFAKVPFDESAMKQDLGVSEVFGEEGYTTLERRWGRPTCDVNGIWGGYQGEGAKTIIPSKASAKISMRLVPNQDPKKIAQLFEDHVRAVAPDSVSVEVEIMSDAPAVLLETEGEIVDAALDAMEAVWGARPLKVREGGSIPIVSRFAETLKVPVLLLGFGLNDDGLHSPNEKFAIEHYYKGIESIIEFLDRLG